MGLSISLPFHSSVCIFLSCLLSSFLFLLFSSSFVSCYDKHDSCHGGIQPWGLCFTSEEWQGRSRTVGDLATCIYLAVPRDEGLAGSAVGTEQVPQSSGHGPQPCQSLGSFGTLLSDVRFGFWVVLCRAKGWTQ